MSEAEWLACESSRPMLEHLRTGSDRTFRLFTCAACRLVWPLLIEEARALVDVAESLADGRVTPRRVGLLKGKLSKAIEAGHAPEVMHNSWCVEVARKPASAAAWRYAWYADSVIPRAGQGGIVRCVFGNPFRPLSFDRSLRTPTAINLATSAYEERILPAGQLDPARLAVLSDALEEAGCADDALLAHLRSPGPHVRGCWALDLVLGKA